eukprot:TRINITY_DN22020_c0_g1_i1.p1 TRINITY_DN22020_c0_g1~~TRINITY_DN22020_c0_g1_i1.p1  ORF type:complete len:354 (-),score=32.57 TRINITY_DN22020_c0_g1_i1:113-1060(-)
MASMPPPCANNSNVSQPTRESFQLVHPITSMPLVMGDWQGNSVPLTAGTASMPSPRAHNSNVSQPTKESCRSRDPVTSMPLHRKDAIEARNFAASKIVLVIRGLPLDWSRQQLLDELDRDGFKDRYEHCYLPCSLEARLLGASNRGFAYLIFADKAFARHFKRSWTGKKVCSPGTCYLYELCVDSDEFNSLEEDLAKELKNRRSCILSEIPVESEITILKGHGKNGTTTLRLADCFSPDSSILFQSLQSQTTHMQQFESATRLAHTHTSSVSALVPAVEPAGAVSATSSAHAIKKTADLAMGKGKGGGNRIKKNW